MSDAEIERLAALAAHAPGEVELEAHLHPTAAAIIEADNALRRAEDHDQRPARRHAAILFQAVIARRGPFVRRLEKELTPFIGFADLSEKAAEIVQGELRDMFRREVEAVIEEAKGR